ncbi:zf-HC2 domain-containing protein [Streptomyces sp. NRRL S-350]|uniref:zf-HC2 domain-containing protein n=1 Tax=Streptomyces sp. NRRL S-350 TaxID=1463902 RepID=UPI0004C1DF3D|nr:zf-HC2 domain-containing protein [Streptomyces sp. NRRL S-350]
MTAHLSSPDPAEAHPPVERLADLAEGLVDSPEAVEALREHLDGCAECRETVEALSEVQALLGTVEAPPMPADVAARLEAALAEEAARAASESPAEPPAGNGRGNPAAARRSSAPTPLARAAAGPSAPPSRPSSSTGPGRSRPRRRFALLLGAATVLAAIGLGGALLLQPDDRAGGPAVTAGAPAGSAAAEQSARAPHATGPGTAYSADRLADQVRQLLARSATAPGLRATGPADSEAPMPAEGARPDLSAPGSPGSPASSPTCQAPAPGVPLATDRGSYQGSPVDVLVYPDPGRPGSVDVYLRSPDCGPVLLHESVPSR